MRHHHVDWLPLLVLLAAASITEAADQPISASKLVLARSGTKAKLVFTSRDPNALFPAIGGPDDPSVGTPGGMVIELFSAAEGIVTITIPAGAGQPGWTTKSGPPASFK